MDTVLAAVNDLHASTGNRVFTLIEIAEAIDGQRVTPPPGMKAAMTVATIRPAEVDRSRDSPIET